MNFNITGFKRQRNSEEKNLPLQKRQFNEIPYMNTALLVDEVHATKAMMQSMLESLGVQTHALNNVQDEIQVLKTGPTFDFIFIDFDLSCCNGAELVKYIRTIGVNSKIVGMCTNGDTEKRRTFFEVGADICIEKPMARGYNLSEVIGHLRNM